MTPPEDAPPEEPEGDDEAARSRVGELLDPFFTDSSLWPVLIAAVLIFVVFGAAILLFAVRTRNLFAVVALIALLFMSADAVRADWRGRRPGRAGGFVLGIWLAAAGVAAVAASYGIL